MYIPTMIFGHLLKSSNYNDEEEKVTGGRNGYCVKLCNIFSTKLELKTASKDEGKSFMQTWTNNIGKTTTPQVKDFNGTEFSLVTFSPDPPKFRVNALFFTFIKELHSNIE